MCSSVRIRACGRAAMPMMRGRPRPWLCHPSPARWPDGARSTSSSPSASGRGDHGTVSCSRVLPALHSVENCNPAASAARSTRWSAARGPSRCPSDRRTSPALHDNRRRWHIPRYTPRALPFPALRIIPVTKRGMLHRPHTATRARARATRTKRIRSWALGLRKSGSAKAVLRCVSHDEAHDQAGRRGEPRVSPGGNVSSTCSLP